MPQKKVTLQPSLYLIFANSEEGDEVDKMSLMKEISTFAGQYICNVIQIVNTYFWYSCILM